MKNNIFLNKIVGFALLIFISTEIKAQQSFTLEEAKNYALKNSYGIKTTQKDYEIAQKQITEIRAAGLPQINGEANFQNFIDIPTQVLPANAFNPAANPNDLVPIQFGTKYSAYGQISASQLIFDGSYIVGLQAAKTYAKSAMQNIQKTEFQIREEVSNAYYAAITAKENVEILKSNLEKNSKIYEESKLILASGLLEETDVEQLELAIANISNGINRAERQEKTAFQLLKFLMGIDINSEIELSSNLEELITSAAAQSLSQESFTSEKNIDYKLIQTQKELMKLNLRKEKFAYLPSIGGFFNLRRDAYRNEFSFLDSDKDWFPNTIWGLRMTLPIFDSGQKYAKIKMAKYEFEKVEILEKQFSQSLALQSERAKGDLESALERYSVEKRNLAIAQKIQNNNLIKYQEGMISSIELNQSQTQFLNTQANYINSIFEVLNAKSSLEKVFNKLN
jgi:outer membrane protein TolC